MSARHKLFAICVSLSGLIAAGGVAQEYAINWSTVDGGGAGVAGASAGGNYTLSGTIGQPDARNHPQPMTGSSYTLTGGFWVIPECPAIPADYDGDCDVDQADYQAFEACATGPGLPQSSPSCAGAKLDSDEDVDQSDFAVFQRCFSGKNHPADPNCAN